MARSHGMNLTQCDPNRLSLRIIGLSLEIYYARTASLQWECAQLFRSEIARRTAHPAIESACEITRCAETKEKGNFGN